MPVFKQWHLDQLIKTLTEISAKALAAAPLWLTMDEFVEAFIIPDHIDKLTEVKSLVGMASMPHFSTKFRTSADDTSEQIAAWVHFSKQPPMLIPEYVKWSLQERTPATAKILEWAVDRRRLGIQLGDAVDCLPYLNEACGNARAFSLMFPAIVPLMARSGAYGSLSNQSKDIQDTDPLVVMSGKVLGVKTIGTLPSLPKAKVDRIRTASAVVMAMTMVDIDSSPEVGGPVRMVGATGSVIGSRPHIVYDGGQTDSFI